MRLRIIYPLVLVLLILTCVSQPKLIGLTQGEIPSTSTPLSPIAQHSIFLPMIRGKNNVIPPTPTLSPTPSPTPSPTSTPPGSDVSWPMVAANLERTSWTPEEVRGNLQPIWYRSIEPYINYKIQIIAANNKLFISTAKGLYALNADNGNVDWIYPTELPLGNSPTVANGIVYVGGYDRRIHAINADTGKLISSWNFYEAEAGFETNPLVVNGTVYAGNRDGYFYALDATTGNLKWRYKTGGPILFSAAYKDNTIYFASNDSYAYALNTNGDLVWKSAKLLGAGFYSYWPVIYTDKATNKDYVIFSGAENYRELDAFLSSLERDDLFPNNLTDPPGTLIGSKGQVAGNWAAGTVTIDVSRILNYYEQKPYRRTVFVLNRATGIEYTFDTDNTGKPEYAPFTWSGTTHSGNKYPPVIGSDGVLYQSTAFYSEPWIVRGDISGWKFGTQYISRVTDSHAVDEPMAYAAGGNIIYWALCCDREAGAFDISKPYNQSNRDWYYFSYDLRDKLPGYQPNYYGNDMNGWGVYGDLNGVYGKHGVQNPPIPYRGKVFMQKGNSIIAFGSTSNNPIHLPTATTVTIQNAPTSISIDQLKQKLENEIQKIINSGHLRPGYQSTGIFDMYSFRDMGDNLIDYWHNPSDTLYTLTRALPYLSASLQQQTRTYLQTEFANYPPYQIADIGWKNGAAREPYVIPNDEISNYSSGPQTSSSGGQWWQNFPPNSFYGAYIYAQEFGGAKNIFDNMKTKLETPPSDSYLAERPYIHNAYIAGYIGYLGLEKLAGYPESSNIRAELNRLLGLRVSQFSKDSPYYVPANTTGGWTTIDYNRTLNISRNFMFLTPDLANYLHDNALTKVQAAVNDYTTDAPYWFVSKYDATVGEGVLQQLFDSNSIFLAKAYILKEPRTELTKYLDVPAFEVGDLFYIQDLIAAIEAP